MNYLELGSFLLFGLLFFIWPIPGVITIRDILIFLLFIMCGYNVYKTKPLSLKSKELAAPFIIIAILTVWIIFEAIFISKETVWSLKEIEGQWLMALAVFITAALFADSTREETFLKRRNIVTLLFSILLAHILCVDLYALYMFIKTSVLPMRVAGLTVGMDKSSYLSHFLLIILCVEIYFRSRQNKAYIPVSNSILFLVMLLTLFSIYLEKLRNGTVIAALLLLAFTPLFFPKNRIGLKKAALLSCAVLVLLSFGYTSFNSDQRWKTFLETLPIALDTQNNKAWINREKYPFPKLKGGKIVDPSNYERIAWFKEGVILLQENPLGVGFGRDAFGHALHKKYNIEGFSAGHSHSGLLDFAIGTGFPGLILWMLFIINMMYRSLRIFRNQKSYCALLLFFISADFTLRAVVDSVIRDHMLQMFMFFAGLLYVLMLAEHNTDLSARKTSG